MSHVTHTNEEALENVFEGLPVFQGLPVFEGLPVFQGLPAFEVPTSDRSDRMKMQRLDDFHMHVCVAVCCSALQRVAVCCSVLQCVAATLNEEAETG